MPVLETERVILRRLRPGDLEPLFALYRDPEIRRYFPEGTLTRDETQAELDWFVNGGDPAHPHLGLWATIERESGDFVGRSGLIPWAIDGANEIEIAYLLAKSRWGRGLGAEIARGLVRHGFEVLGLQRLIALIHPANEASIRTAQAAGLRFERKLNLPGEECGLYAIEA
ncbi:MAG: GNAT family N-acetyltransferase [Proteobacteria bacterium]|nr:GNAT family N-acetyltransferase [Pseudomonadota bacterium]